MSQKEKIIETYKKGQVVDSFDSERSKYAFQRYKHKVEADFLKKAIKEIKKDGVRVLDVGCGTGRMLPEVFKTKKKIEYHGLDTSKSMLKELKERAKKLNKSRYIKTYIADATKMPFKDNTFDIVYSFHLLWHIEKKDQEKVVKEMVRVTGQGGLIVFDILNKNFIWEKSKKFLGKKKAAGLYKISLREAKEIIGKVKRIEIEKLSDAPIKINPLYKIFNLINKMNKLFPSSLYHMLYLRVKK